MMNRSLQEAVVKTLVYADIFDYPLTEEEIGRWLISSRLLVVSSKLLNSVIADLKGVELVSEGEDYYCLKGREEVFKVRKRREGWSEDKWIIAKRVGRWLGWIPTVKVVAVTGTLAMNNCREDDDIDLMIITCRGWLWTSRLLVTGLSVLLGLKRRPGRRVADNKVCINVWLSEEDLEISPGKYGLYLAHEVLQAEPVVDKDGVYGKFLMANEWVRKWLPEAWKARIRQCFDDAREDVGVSGASGEEDYGSGSWLCSNENLIEKLAFRLQRWYMKGKVTRELVKPTRAMFHPEDVGEKVMERYEKRVRARLKVVAE